MSNSNVASWSAYRFLRGRSASVLPMNIQGWFPLGLTGLISVLSRGLLRVLSAPQFEGVNCSVLSLLDGPTLTSICDYWKNPNFDYVDFCKRLWHSQWIRSRWMWGFPCFFYDPAYVGNLKGMSLLVRAWQNLVHWRREWQTTSVFLIWEPHKQYEKEKPWLWFTYRPLLGNWCFCFLISCLGLP